VTYRGQIKNGVAVLDSPVALPDGTRVRVEVETAQSEFKMGKSVEELAREQGVKPVSDLSKLTIAWPADESLDDFLALVREVRH
jgi:predicted DNA-binding antitoxin AbrB/MazE fold protein